MLLPDAENNAAAAAEAAAELAEHGYVQGGDGAWSGHLRPAHARPIRATVALPPEFPHAMPVVRVSAGDLPRPIPHMEANGKLCLAPESGVLLDASNPRGIVRESLVRACRVVQDGLCGLNDRDFVSEFSGYWNAGARGGLLSVVDPTGKPRQMVLVRPDVPVSQPEVLAEDLGAAREWLASIGRKPVSHRAVMFVPLARPFRPPEIGRALTVEEALSKIQRCSTQDGYVALLDHLKCHRLPLTVAFSLPVSPREDVAVGAFRFEEAYGHARLHATRGNGRTGRSTTWELWCAKDQPVTRLRVDRGDPAFLLPRGGTDARLLGKRVVIAGCGSVGARVAEHLALMGVGQLVLIDPELMSPENVHRHLLGATHVGLPKAAGVASALQRRFPHLRFEHHDQTVQQVLATDPSTVRDADAVLLALGDETLELRLNDLLADTAAIRVHTWVEPLGLGGHVLICGPSGRPGCYRCLFGWGHRFANAASFAEPGQTFHRTLSGCAGAFTPYAALDADRTAIEAVRGVVSFLSSPQPSSILVSWFGDDSTFRQQGFRVSSRASLFSPGDRRATNDFTRVDCSCCGRNRP
jgi:hypothetical protein